MERKPCCTLETALGGVPAGGRRALDLGCGEGETTRRLPQHVAHATGLDRDVTSIDSAANATDDITYVIGDIIHPPFRPSSFDVVTGVAVLHHVNPTIALKAAAQLVAPGGVLVVVGLARSRGIVDKMRDVRDAVMFRVARRRHPVWEPAAPRMWLPPLSHAETATLRSKYSPERGSNGFRTCATP